MKDAHAPSTSPATLYKTQNTFIRYLHIYLSSLQHLLNLLNNFNRYCFLPTVEKYQRGEKNLFVEKIHAEVYIRRILAASCNKTNSVVDIPFDKNDASIEKKTKKYSVWIFLIV